MRKVWIRAPEVCLGDALLVQAAARGEEPVEGRPNFGRPRMAENVHRKMGAIRADDVLLKGRRAERSG